MKALPQESIPFCIKEDKVRGLFRTLSSPLKGFWKRQWKGTPPSPLLFLSSLFISLLMAVPIIYVAVRSFFAGHHRWLRLLDSRIPKLLWNTLSLAFTVTLFSMVLGVSLAIIIHRYRLPGKKIWKWLLALPLLVPPYVGAVSYIAIFGPRGWLKTFWPASPFRIYSFWGVVFVLTIFCYPYVYLITHSALRKTNKHLEEASRTLGLKSSEIIWKVILPSVRPAIGAGGILVFLYVLSDFGAISILRYQTFTSAIYSQMGSYDNLSATILSMILICLTLFVLWLESISRKRQKFYQTSRSSSPSDPLPLKKWKMPVLLYLGLVFFVSFLLPLSILIYWSSFSVLNGSIDKRFWVYFYNSMRVSGLTALICMLFALPVVYLKSRNPSPISSILEKLSSSGYAIPGVIVALGIIFLFNRYIPWIYQTYFIICIALVVRYLPQAMQSVSSSLSLVSPNLDEASRNLGYGTLMTLKKVILPLIAPGILAGGALVFVSSMKELPATLLLRPPGFDTLAIRIWVETSESMYYAAAPYALLMISLAMIPLKWMLNKY
jgi:iron(III) transport system permease protein